MAEADNNDNKPHWNTGNRYAAKAKKFDDKIILCCYKEDKAIWELVAESANKLPAQWYREALNAAAESELNKQVNES